MRFMIEIRISELENFYIVYLRVTFDQDGLFKSRSCFPFMNPNNDLKDDVERSPVFQAHT